jgi:hydrogenase nickel incorporation protein HypB
MCGTCGCESGKPERGTLVPLERSVLARNDEIARRNRAWFEERSILVLNVLSSPGSGKTTLLERTIRDLHRELSIFVVEGDQATDHDARRVRAAGARALQINTGSGCHLDAAMVSRALEELEPPARSVLFIENVGNLVCPALFDLGESARVVVASVTDGEDKPVKYPHMFRRADLLVLNKIDLARHTEFDARKFDAFFREVSPSAGAISLSAKTGEGVSVWYEWLRSCHARTRARALSRPEGAARA